MPFSRSRSIESRTWLVIWRASIVWVSSRSRSARVDFPWSMWAMMLKLRSRSWGMATRRECIGSPRAHMPATIGGPWSGRDASKDRHPSHDQDYADQLHPRQALAEQYEGRDGRERRELAAHDRRDWNALARAPGREHRSDD